MGLQVERFENLNQVRAFALGTGPVDFESGSREKSYELARRTLSRFDYAGLGKADRGVVKRFLEKATGMSRAQTTRLVRQYLATGRIVDGRRRRADLSNHKRT